MRGGVRTRNRNEIFPNNDCDFYRLSVVCDCLWDDTQDRD